MAGPSEVEFPGKQRRRMRMRGTKQASESVKKRLRKSLNALLEDTSKVIPEITGPTSRGFKPDRMKSTVKNLNKVIDKREDRKWLMKRMAKTSSDIGTALAGSLIAAHEDDVGMVAVWNHPIYGQSSYIRKGNGKPNQYVGLQLHNNPKLRLLPWEDLARSGYWFFSWSGGFVCSGVDAVPPKEWLVENLNASPLALDEDEDGVWSTGSGSERIVMKFNNDTEVSVGLDSISSAKESCIQSLAMSMMPPHLNGIMEAEVDYRPVGWPEDLEVPDQSITAMNEVVNKWLRLEIEDKALRNELHQAFLLQRDDDGEVTDSVTGLVVGKQWFDHEQLDDFKALLNGAAIEREAVACVIEELQGGIWVDSNGEVVWLTDELVYLEDNNAHSLLTATWEDYGLDVLEQMFEMTGSDADAAYEKQLSRGKAFGSFLKKLDEQQSGARLLRAFPWRDGALPSPLDFADKLMKTGRIGGVGKTTSMARKTKGDGNLAVGWAWLVTHGRGTNLAFHFTQDIRDKGGDWVPAMERLWIASEAVAESGETKDYVAAMKQLRQVMGIIDKLPKA